MSHLLYCIAASMPALGPPPLKGVADQSVQWRSYGELCVAVSELALPPPATDVAQMLRYSEVIAALHQSGTVIPLRYGCAFAHDPQIEAWLTRRQAAYQRLLAHLEGCTEVSVRLWLQDEPTPAAASVSWKTHSPGHVYLAQLQQRHAQQDQCRRRLAAEGQRYQTAVGDLARDWHPEYREENRILMLHSLVPHTALAPFHAACDTLVAQPGFKVSFSGPWPPYNFVLDGD